MHCFNITPRKARKNHRCTCCGGIIHSGELYLRWANVDDGFFTNKAHHECYSEIKGEYDLYDIERPDHRLTNLGLVLLYEKWGWRTDRVKNYQRPVLITGLL